MIVESDWFDLTTQPEPVVIAVVKEFYANSKEHYLYGVKIWGKIVSFASIDINMYYNLPIIGDINQYTSFVH